MKIFLVLLSITVLLLGCKPPQIDVPDTSMDFRKTYPREAYLKDLDELAKRLIDTHPQPFEFISQEDFSNLVEEKKRSVTANTTMGEFIWMYSSIISSIGCSHTTLGYFNQEDALLPISLRFPLEAQFINSKLYVTDPLINADLISPGDEILSINGISTEDVQKGIFEHIPTDGHSRGFKENLANTYFTAYIAYYFQFADTYQVRTNNSRDNFTLKTLEQYSYKPLTSPGNACQDKLCFKVSDDGNTAMMTIKSSAYYGDDTKIFQAYVDSSFSKIAANNINYLILDFRGNMGGSSSANSYLLQYFANSPFIFFDTKSSGSENEKQEKRPFYSRFTGKVFILIDGFGLSSTGHFLSLVKVNEYATLVGEESGSTYTCNDNSIGFESSHTGISYKIARNTFYTTAKGLPKNRGILPDYEIIPGIDAVISTEDTVLQYTLNLVAQDRVSYPRRDGIPK